MKSFVLGFLFFEVMLLTLHIWSYFRIADDSNFARNVGGVLVESGAEFQDKLQGKLI